MLTLPMPKQRVCSSWAELEPGHASPRALPPSHVNKLLQCILADTLMSPADLVSILLLLNILSTKANSQQWSRDIDYTEAANAVSLSKPQRDNVSFDSVRLSETWQQHILYQNHFQLINLNFWRAGDCLGASRNPEVHLDYDVLCWNTVLRDLWCSCLPVCLPPSCGRSLNMQDHLTNHESPHAPSSETTHEAKTTSCLREKCTFLARLKPDTSMTKLMYMDILGKRGHANCWLIFFNWLNSPSILSTVCSPPPARHVSGESANSKTTKYEHAPRNRHFLRTFTSLCVLCY